MEYFISLKSDTFRILLPLWEHEKLWHEFCKIQLFSWDLDTNSIPSS